MATLESLSFDILFNILDKEYISVADIANISATSKFFNCLGKNNCLWWNKFKRFWPSSAKKYSSPDKDWKSQFKERYFYKKIVKKKLHDLSRDCYHTRRITFNDLKAFNEHTDKNTIVFVMEELESIIEDSNRDSNLTEKFYSSRVLRYLHLVHISNAWAKVFETPLPEVSFFEVACLFSRWCQPFDPDFTPEVSAQISDIAKCASLKLMEEHPEHPALKEKIKVEDILGVLNYSLWETEQCLEVLKCLNHVMFKDMKFIFTNSADKNFDNFYIEKVLSSKNGSILIVSIIYAAAAALLGVSCYPISLRTSQTYLKLNARTDTEAEDYIFIDIMNEGSFRNFQNMRDLYPTYPAEDYRYIRNWCDIRDALMMCSKITHTLFSMRRSKRFTRSLFMVQVQKLDECLKKRIHCYVKTSLKEVSSFNLIEMTEKSLSIINLPNVIPDIIYDRSWFPTEDFPVRQKLRYTNTHRIKYAVGMIMRHKEKNYRCVIYSWDYKAEMMWCNSTFSHVHSPNSLYIPHYRVLVDDDSVCYVHQGSLKIDFCTEPVKNWRIGKYFESFHGQYYMPNKMTQSIYPEDIAALEQTLGLQHLQKFTVEDDVIILDG